MNNGDTTEILIEFAPVDQVTLEAIKEMFTDEEYLLSSGFDGTSVVTIIMAVSASLGQVFRFYAKHKDSLKSAKIKITGKEINLEGFSADEINEMAEKGTIQKIQEKLK